MSKCVELKRKTICGLSQSVCFRRKKIAVFRKGPGGDSSEIKDVGLILFLPTEQIWCPADAFQDAETQLHCLFWYEHGEYCPDAHSYLDLLLVPNPKLRLPPPQ